MRGSLTEALARARRMMEDAASAAVLLREVEEARFVEGPAPLLARLRSRGGAEAPRSAFERRVLFAVVRRLDAFLLPEPNCYRRSLVQVALDRTAASEPLVLGLDVTAGGRQGHAWVAGTETQPAPFEVEFRV